MISESYLDALLPSFVKSVISGFDPIDKSISELETSFVSYMDQVSTDINKTDNVGKVVVIDFIGPVVKYYDWWYGILGTQEYMQLLDRFKNDPTISAVVMKTDSGGGQKYGTPEFYDYITEFKKTKPFVIYTSGLLCSGAYYFAAPASYIIANKRADAIGSIGIYTEIFDWNGYYESIGLKVHTIYSDLSDEKNKSHRDVISGSDKNYKNYIKKELDPDGQKFIDDMKTARPQLKEAVFHGGTWNGEEAVEMGLCDANGTLKDAIAKAFELAEKSSNQNSNTNMSKQLVKVQAVLGLDAPLVSTEENGSYLNSDQLDTLENRLVELDASNSDLQTKLDAALANTEVKDQLTATQGTVTALEASIDGMLTSAGLDVKGTLTEKTAALTAKVEEMGKADGASHTNPKVDATILPKNDFVDSSASHNQIANSIK